MLCKSAGWLQEAVEARSCMAISILAVVVATVVVCSAKGFTKLIVKFDAINLGQMLLDYWDHS